jgi:hypothetical protein
MNLWMSSAVGLHCEQGRTDAVTAPEIPDPVPRTSPLASSGLSRRAAPRTCRLQNGSVFQRLQSRGRHFEEVETISLVLVSEVAPNQGGVLHASQVCGARGCQLEPIQSMVPQIRSLPSRRTGACRKPAAVHSKERPTTHRGGVEGLPRLAWPSPCMPLPGSKGR